MNKKSSSIRETANNEKGALLLSMVIIIVVFAVLGAVLLSITSTSTFTQVYSNNATKAYYMAESGFRYASMNIVTVSKGGENCLKCHSSHGKETIRYSAGYTTLPDDMIKVHGETYPRNDQDILDGGTFTVRLAPFWFEAESLDGANLKVSAVKTSDEFAVDFGETIQCDFPGIFTDGTITDEGGGGLYIGGKYISYTSINVSDPDDGTLTFTGVNPVDISLQEGGDFFDVFPACLAAGQSAINSGGDLLIATAAELNAFPDTKSVIEIHSMDADGPVVDSDGPVTHLVSYDNVDADIGKFTGLGDVDKSNPVVDGLVVSKYDIVVLSKTLKITSTGTCSEASKKLVYYRWIGRPMTVPIVYNTAKPDEDKLLAGGNFYWVSDVGGNDDATGHNVFDISGMDVAITGTDINRPNKAPGLTKSEGCAVCHFSLAAPEFIEYEISGCTGCHRVPHPLLTPPPASYPLSAPGDEYCFLRGHRDADELGVTGIKDKKDQDGNVSGDWQYSKDSSDHNEYRGIAGTDGEGLKDYLYTTTGYCTGCHGKFRSAQKDVDGDWIRHPSDWVIPKALGVSELDKDKKFYDAFGSGGTDTGTYDPDVPVARANPTSISSEVKLGSDMVMCLSCHVAHGSQYTDMLRWNYDVVEDVMKDKNYMIVGTTGAGQGKGCFKCHTDKDNEVYYAGDEGRHCNDCHTMHDSQNGISVGGPEAYAYLLKDASPPTCPHE